MDTFDRLYLFMQNVARMRELQTTGTLSDGWVTPTSLPEAERMLVEMLAPLLGREMAAIPPGVVRSIADPIFMVELLPDGSFILPELPELHPLDELPEIPPATEGGVR